MLIHAVREAIDPVRAAFAAAMPHADVHDLLETSLSADLAAENGVLSAAMIERFRTLGRYAAATTAAGRTTDAILFTCSAFGPAIEAVQRDLAIPVLKPNEAAFRQALAQGQRIGLMVTFEPSLAPLRAELEALAEGNRQSHAAGAARRSPGHGRPARRPGGRSMTRCARRPRGI